jgi:hypothetical protein
MRRSLMLSASLALLASLTGAATAGPITGTVTMTVAPAGPSNGTTGPGIVDVASYSSGLVNLSTLPDGMVLRGPTLGLDTAGGGGPINDSVSSTFQMTITFNGPTGIQPSINITGTISGYAVQEESAAPGGPLAPGQNAGLAVASFVATPISATVTSATVDWPPVSGVPASLIDQYLNLSNYRLSQYVSQAPGFYLPPADGNFVLTILPAAVPEPATILVYLAAIVGLGLRHGARLRRSRSDH